MINASIVTYHTNFSLVLKALEGLLNSSVSKIYIIDNSSNDSLRELNGISNKIIYIHSINLGYGAGHNIALRRSLEMGALYHIVLNPDIFFDKNAIEQLLSYMNNNFDCGLVMPKILYPNGDIQKLCKLLPTPLDLFGRRFLPNMRFLDNRNKKYELHFTQYNKIMNVPSLSGCFMFMRLETLKQVGVFDERYFMYAEDLDLCRRIGKVSRTVFYPNAIAYHNYEKGSYKSRKMLKYHMVSVVKYFNKWGWLIDGERRRVNKKCIKMLGVFNENK